MAVVEGYLIWAFRDFYITRAQQDLVDSGRSLAQSLAEPLGGGRDGVPDLNRVGALTQAFPAAPWITVRVFDAAGSLIAVKIGYDPPGSKILRCDPPDAPDSLAVWTYDTKGQQVGPVGIRQPVPRAWYDRWLAEAVGRRQQVTVSLPQMEAKHEK